MRLHRLLVPAGILTVVAAFAVPAASAPGDIASKRQQVAELDRELSAVDAEAGAAAAAHNAALDRRDAVERRIGETRIEVRLTTRQLRGSRERLGERMVALYVRGTPDPFEALLQSGDLADVLAVTDLLERTAASDAAVVARVRERRQASGGRRAPRSPCTALRDPGRRPLDDPGALTIDVRRTTSVTVGEPRCRHGARHYRPIHEPLHPKGPDACTATTVTTATGGGAAGS